MPTRPAPPEIVAHRGAGADRHPPIAGQAHRPAAPPENTLAALAWGWAAARACEIDVHLTRDRRVVVIHDPKTGRICDRDLRVADSDFAELRRLDAGARKGAPWNGLRLPSLGEALALIPPGGRLYIEAKSGPAIVEPLLADVAAAGCAPGQVVPISFGLDTIRALKRARPDLTCYWVLGFTETAPGRWRAQWEETAEGEAAPHTVWQDPVDCAVLAELVGGERGSCRLDGLDVSARQPDDFAAVMAGAGIPWGAWTIDDAATALALAAKGAIQLTTNCPADLTAALAHAGLPA